MIHQLPSLPYDYNALEPHIDAQTMEIHHNRHHGGYVKKLNSILEGYPELADVSLERMLTDLRIVPEEIRQAVRNNAGGHHNHSLFWRVMCPPGAGGEPSGVLLEGIESVFGSLAHLREEVTSQAINRFGSGWAWLSLDHNGRLEVISTPNQDSPLMLGYVPILGVDVWEHAYYLKYQNRRADYLAAWWNLVDWRRVSENYVWCMHSLATSRQA
mgnify:FL=1